MGGMTSLEIRLFVCVHIVLIAMAFRESQYACIYMYVYIMEDIAQQNSKQHVGRQGDE